MYNHPMSYVINMVNIHSAARKLTFDLIFTKQNFIIIKLFKKLHLVHNIILINKSNKLYIKVYLYYYKNSRLGSNLKVMSTPSKAFYASLNALRLLNKRSGSSVFLISNDRGLMTHKESIKKKSGGLLLGVFSL